MTQSRGKFIAVDGIDGAGKGTVLNTLANLLTHNGYEVHQVREPGGSVVGEKIRGIFKEHWRELSPNAKYCLMRAQSLQLMETVIAPRLKAGQIILSDRCFASTVAYDGRTMGVDFVMDDIIQGPFAKSFIRPDLAIWLDVSLEKSAYRRDARGEDEDDTSGLGFARQTYRKLASLGYLKRVDADRGIDFVETDCANLVLDCLQNRVRLKPSS